MRDRTTNTVISHIKSIFAHFAIQEVVISNNGSQFSSSTFKKFSSDWDFQHVFCSPKHPRLNGMAESAVKVDKRIFKKTNLADEDPYLALLGYRSTPSTNDQQSPAGKLLGRPARTNPPDLRKMIPKTQAKKDPCKQNTNSKTLEERKYISIKVPKYCQKLQLARQFAFKKTTHGW